MMSLFFNRKVVVDDIIDALSKNTGQIELYNQFVFKITSRHVPAP